MARVRLGYFEDFKSTNALLLEADAEGLRALADTFRSVAAASPDGVALHQLPFVEVHHGVQLVAACANHDRGPYRTHGRYAFAWQYTADGWRDAADKLDLLMHYDNGHHYFEADHDQLVVQVSKDEYGDAWWLEHG